MNILRSKKFYVFVVALAAQYSPVASAITVNFNGTAGQRQTFYGVNVTYVEQGVSILAPIGTYMFFDSPSFGYGAPSPDASDHMQIDGGSVSISLPTPFSFRGFQGGSAAAAYHAIADSIILTGHQVGTTETISYTLNLSVGTMWNDVVLPATWTNLTSVDMIGFSESFGAMFLDNINVVPIAAVSEPSAFALLGGALLGAGALRRRSTK